MSGTTYSQPMWVTRLVVAVSEGREMLGIAQRLDIAAGSSVGRHSLLGSASARRQAAVES